MRSYAVKTDWQVVKKVGVHLYTCVNYNGINLAAGRKLFSILKNEYVYKNYCKITAQRKIRTTQNRGSRKLHPTLLSIFYVFSILCTLCYSCLLYTSRCV